MPRRPLGRSPPIDTQVRSSACDDVAVLRSVTVGVAMSVLATACTLVTEPVPAGTVPVQATINNATAQAVPLAITTLTGVIPGAVRPTTTAPGHSKTDVTFYFPRGGDWAISVGPESGWGPERLRADVKRMLEGCRVFIKIKPDSRSLSVCNPEL